MTALLRRVAPGRARTPAARAAHRTSELPPLAPSWYAARGALLLLAALAGGLAVHLVLVSPFQQRAAQQRAYDDLRADLAAGTAPVAAAALRPGDPVAFIEIPAIGLRQVVLEGTASGTLADGPGHRRDTPLPGQAGTSVVMGRRSAYGGPFGRVVDLDRGDTITVTTGAGVVDYRVRSVRRQGDPVPAPLEAGGGRLVLVTADGSPFVPSGAVLVDADLVVPPLGSSPPALAPGSLPAAERAMASDPTTLWRLVLWLQALLAVALAAVWAWNRWARPGAWVALFPPLLLVGLSTAAEVSRLLPNLL